MFADFMFHLPHSPDQWRYLRTLHGLQEPFELQVITKDLPMLDIVWYGCPMPNIYLIFDIWTNRRFKGVGSQG